MGYIDFFMDHKDDTDEILDIMELWFRDVLVLKQGGYQGCDN